MSNCQRQILEQKVELLEIQIEQQKKREEMLRNERDILIQQLTKIDEINQQTNYLEQQNQFLEKTMMSMKQRNQEQVIYYNTQISKLKGELNEKIKDIQRSRIQYEKRQLKYLQKISLLEKMVEKKCGKITQLESQMHQSMIKSEKQNIELATSTIRYCETQNNMRASNISSLSRVSRVTQRKNKIGEYMNMDKSQMKIVMKGLMKSKNQLEKTQKQINSHKGNSTIRNKTFYN